MKKQIAYIKEHGDYILYDVSPDYKYIFERIATKSEVEKRQSNSRADDIRVYDKWAVSQFKKIFDSLRRIC